MVSRRRPWLRYCQPDTAEEDAVQDTGPPFWLAVFHDQHSAPGNDATEVDASFYKADAYRWMIARLRATERRDCAAMATDLEAEAQRGWAPIPGNPRVAPAPDTSGVEFSFAPTRESGYVWGLVRYCPTIRFMDIGEEGKPE